MKGPSRVYFVVSTKKGDEFCFLPCIRCCYCRCSLPCPPCLPLSSLHPTSFHPLVVARCLVMDSSDDFTPIDDGLHPAARHRSAFYVPSPPDDKDLLVFSTAVFSTSPAAILASWLEQLAVQQLQSAATAAERLRANRRGPVPAPLAPPPPSRVDGPSVGLAPQPVSAPPAADPGAVRLPARGPDQVICRGIESFDELIQAWETRLHGYKPLHKLRNSALGVLGPTQVNVLSDAHTAWIKVKEIGRGKKRASVGAEYSCHFSSLTVELPKKWLASPSFRHAESRRVHRPPVQFEQTPLRHQGRTRAAAATVTAAQMSTAIAVADAGWAGPVGGGSEGKDGQHPSIQPTTNLTNKYSCRRSGSSIASLVVLCLRSSGDSVRPPACCPPKPSSRAGSQATPATPTARVGGPLDGLGKGVRARASARSSMCTAADCRCGPGPRRPPGCGKWRRRRKVVRGRWEGEGARNMSRHPATFPMSAAFRGGSSAFAFASPTATAATAFGTLPMADRRTQRRPRLFCPTSWGPWRTCSSHQPQQVGDGGLVPCTHGGVANRA